MLERFTEPARHVVAWAREEAGLLDHGYVGSEHLLLGLVREEQGVAATVLEDMGLDLASARDQVARVAQPTGADEAGQLSFTRPAIKVFELALRELLAFGDPYVGTPHVLLGLTRANDDVAERLLLDLGAPPERVVEEVLRLRSASDGSWEEGAWDEPVAAAPPASRKRHKRLRATSVRAAVDVALDAANVNAREAGRMVDLGDLLLVLAEGWPEDLVARAFTDLGVGNERLREVVEAARRRSG